MRNFYYRCVQNIFTVCVCLAIVFSYRLVYNEFYFEIHEEVEVSQSEEKQVYPMGKIVGLYTKCNGVFVIDTCEIETENGELIDIAGKSIKTGDYIISINGESLSGKEDMLNAVKNSDGKPLELVVERDKETYVITLSPLKSKNGDYMLGIWVKDDLAGVGTITYFTTEGDFAALGHGMGDGETQNLLEIDGGDTLDFEFRIWVDRSYINNGHYHGIIIVEEI